MTTTSPVSVSFSVDHQCWDASIALPAGGSLGLCTHADNRDEAVALLRAAARRAARTHGAELPLAWS